MSVTPKEQLLQRIHDHSAVIAIIGLGYVGLPLGVAFAENGFSVVGIDVDAAKVEAINRGESYISDIPSARLLAVTGDARLRATTDYAELGDCDVAIVCVPTPLNKTRDPDVRYLIAAGDSVARTIHPGMLVVLESTTYPGTTEDLLLPKLQQARPVEPWQVGEDFFVAFSPERIDPGRLDWTVERTPKVVGGMTPACLEAASLLYGQAIDRIVPVSSPAAAEMTKLLENTFRAVNIALVNEVAIMCDKLGLDVWEVIEAAATKPYGFMKFTPGPGVGGHCLDGSETIRYRWGDENGVLPVSELHRRALQRSRRIVPYHGATFVAPTGLEVLSIDLEDGRQSWQPVSYLFERPYKGEVTRIETVDHRRLLVTDRHPMLVHEDGRLAVREAKDLAAGALLPVANATADAGVGQRSVLNIIDAIPPHLAAAVRVRATGGWRLALTTLRKLLGDRADEVVRHNSLPLTAWRTLPAAMQGDASDLTLATGRGPAFSTFPAVIAIDESFARLAGYYLAEGCISDGNPHPRLRFTFARDELEYLGDVRQMLAAWGLRASTYNDPTWNSTTLKVAGWLLPWLFRDHLGMGSGSRDMRAPDVLMAADNAVRLELLKGLFRGDGDVHVRIGKRRYQRQGRDYEHEDNIAQVGYFSSSPELFNQVTFLLQELGLTPSFKRDKPQLRFYASADVESMRDWFLGAKRQRLVDLEAARQRRTRTRRPQAQAPYALAQVRNVTLETGDTKVYGLEVAGAHTFAASTGIYVHNCIPLDPHYLSWKLKTLNYNARFIQLAGEINTEMPRYWVDKVQDALNDAGKPLKNSRVLVLGVAYKKDIDDVRESPALDIVELLRAKGADVRYHDPHVTSFSLDGLTWASEPDLGQALAEADCALIVTDHSSYDWPAIAQQSKLVVDTRNVV
ncbi:MAG: nucleotide sugar dehydrogenase [Caldilineales bacterium]|nr:nucleotide sugar dehydrogenase [Caldilineales bacterium]MCW5856712.1 nucleotide sugar dehydrogenase [Caldilineales bacterium]